MLEDLHWADEATLDVVRLLARRIETLPALVLATFRDDELDRSHPLRIVVGELPAGGAVGRLAIARLSAGAVAALAAAQGVDAAELHRRTGGNPFFVTEVLAAGGPQVPDTVRDAVLARAARLGGGARSVLEAVAIVPQRAELWLLAAVAGENLGELEACVASGMLHAHGDAVAFRHEIARIAIEDTLPPDRRLHLHRAALAALSATPARSRDLARLAHHADAAGDADAVLRHAPAAGEQAAALGAHREAAAQFERALRFADGLPSERRAELLERWSYECYLTDRVADAIAARRLALDEYCRAGNRLREGDTRRWLSRLAWFTADNATAEDEGQRAVELLEALEPGRELAMAYSNVAQLRMLADDGAQALRWGKRAIELAERLGETEILAHALNNVGSAHMRVSIPDGVAKLRRSLDLALQVGLEEHVARAYTNRRHRGEAARLRARRPLARRRHGVLARARPRRLAALHERLEGAIRSRPGARRTNAARAWRARRARRAPRGDAEQPGRTYGPRARGAHARGAGLAQRRDRRPAVPVGEDRRPSRVGDPAQARRAHPRPGGVRGRPPGHRRKIGSPPDATRRAAAYRRRPRSTTSEGNCMQLYTILRRSGWRSPADLQEAAVRSKQVADDQMPDDVRWIRSYVLEEGGGSVGTVCIYQATSPEAIRKHAQLADLPVDEIIAVADTVIIREDPQPATA